MYTQLIAPNLNTVGDVGWCLAFVEKAYNDTNYSYATARDGWDACQFIHQDRNLPPDVSVPIWFDYYESGIDYGHVAINVPGRGVLSSPYKADNTQQWFTSIDECAQVLRCTYLGWSEDLMGVRVITGGTMVDDNITKKAYLTAEDKDLDSEQGGQAVYDYWRGRPVTELLDALYKDNEQFRYKANNYDKVLAELNAVGAPTQLKQGIYKVN